MEIKRDEIKKMVFVGGKVRKTKPNDRKSYVHGDAAYVWRNVAFTLGLTPATTCLPMMADCYLWDSEFESYVKVDYRDSDAIHTKAEMRRARMKELDKIVDEIVNAIPKSEWKGVARWASALGYRN